jgi:hypothetical protein
MGDYTLTIYPQYVSLAYKTGWNVTLSQPQQHHKNVGIVLPCFASVHEFVNFGRHLAFERHIERVFLRIEIAFHYIDSSIRELKDRFAIEDMILLAAEHDSFENHLRRHNTIIKPLKAGRGGDTTHVESFHGPDLPASFHRLVDLLIERLPIIERTNLQELDQGVEFLDTVLPIDTSVLITSTQICLDTYMGVPVRHHLYLPSRSQHPSADLVLRFLML